MQENYEWTELWRRCTLTSLLFRTQKKIRAELANQWHATFTAVPFFFSFLFAWPVTLSLSLFLYIYIYIYIYVCVCVCVCVCVYTTHTHTHMSDCVEIVHELPLLPNNAASETYLHKSGEVWSGDWIFTTAAPAWRWLGEYVTLDKGFYNLLFRQEVVATQVTSIFSSLSHY